MPLHKVILAPDSFKESLSAAEVAHAMADGVRRVSDAIIAVVCPIADGGEGTLDCLMSATNGVTDEMIVCGPNRQRITSRFGRFQRTADGRSAVESVGVIDLALASGLALLPPENLIPRDPMQTTTFGTGELMLAAMDAGCDELLMGIGGSATVDGGTGIAQALGFRFFDADGREITHKMCGELLHRIARIERPLRVWPRIRVACDVTNPLCGPSGAAYVYGPQKGATPEQVRMLDDGLANLAHVAGERAATLAGAGAAGGAGYGLMTFLNATLERGIDLVLDSVGFDAMCDAADLVITGEGRLDRQSLFGKACMGVASAASKHGVPTIAIVGSTGPGAAECVRADGLSAYHTLTDRFGLDRALHDAHACIAELTMEVVRTHHV